MAQAVECLPSKYKVLSSNPSTTKRKQQQQNIGLPFKLFVALSLTANTPAQSRLFSKSQCVKHFKGHCCAVCPQVPGNGYACFAQYSLVIM
jgi:hypothetical protein